MAYAFVIATADGSTSSNGFTTTAADFTGVDTIFVTLHEGSGTGAETLSSSPANTWNKLTTQTVFGSISSTIYYALAASVNNAMTFSITGTGTFPSISAMGFSGGAASAAFDAENGSTQGFSSTVQTGAVSPAVNDEVVVSGLGWQASATPSIDSSFTLPAAATWIPSGFGSNSVTQAYIIQTTAGSVNPTWTVSFNSTLTACIACFKKASAAAGRAHLLPLLGVS